VAAVCLSALVIAGCGPSGGLKTVKAKLKAQYEDGTPLPAVFNLQLHPEGEGKHIVTSGMPVSGEYTLMTTLGEQEIDGAPPGKYKVTVSGALMGGAGATPAPECASPEKTPLTVEISESGAVTPDTLKIPLAKAKAKE
jgi:hypothetical protein